MILFLNFAPISFMGGAEKWMNDTAKKINQQEKTVLVSVAGSIASIYSTIVLKRKFDNRSDPKDLHQNFVLDFKAFIPFTSSWNKAKNLFKQSSLIYARYELLEFLILFYFAGRSGFKKTIAGLHSPFIYSLPESFFDHLHNFFYGSILSQKILSITKKIHVLNKRDYQVLKNDYGLQHVTYVPNGMPTQNLITNISSDNKLHILYVGELSLRKGIDRLIEVIEKAPRHFVFTIAGDGPYKMKIQQLAHENSHCIYKGFVNQTDLPKLYTENEVLFLPSRAESMPLSILEALSYGLVIVDSSEISLQLRADIEYSVPSQNSVNFINVFNQIYNEKKAKKIKPRSIKSFFQTHFSSEIVDKSLSSNIFDLSL